MLRGVMAENHGLMTGLPASKAGRQIVFKYDGVGGRRGRGAALRAPCLYSPFRNFHFAGSWMKLEREFHIKK